MVHHVDCEDTVAVYAGPLDAVPVRVQVPADAGAVNNPASVIEPQETP